jgi:hypothetical protein
MKTIIEQKHIKTF